ncbi:hypothetical protein ADJ79_10585 [Ottowia sp. oral taxon 894]|nr:hypothetical protein ADJ79_10585 [Ottowia sp. oral taxon 894]
MQMELAIFEALTAANVPADKAKAVASSIDAAIDRRYSLHSQQLATRGDVENARKEIGELRGEVKAEAANIRGEMAKMQSEIIKWCVGAIFTSTGLTLAIVKMLS